MSEHTNAYENFPYRAELERRVYAFLGQEQQRDEGTFIQAMVHADGNGQKAAACSASSTPRREEVEDRALT